MKLRVGDEVLITAGKDRGKKEKIEKVFPKKERVLVSNVNVYKRTRRGFGGQKGGVFEFSRPLPVANIALICPQCGRQTRVVYRADKRGDKERVCVKCKREIDVRGGKR